MFPKLPPPQYENDLMYGTPERRKKTAREEKFILIGFTLLMLAGIIAVVYEALR